MAEQQPFPKYVLANCHPDPTIFCVVPDEHEHEPTESNKCVAVADLCYVFSDGILRPRYDAMQEILRRSNAFDDLVAALEAIELRASNPSFVVDRARRALAKARGES